VEKVEKLWKLITGPGPADAPVGEVDAAGKLVNVSVMVSVMMISLTTLELGAVREVRDHSEPYQGGNRVLNDPVLLPGSKELDSLAVEEAGATDMDTIPPEDETAAEELNPELADEMPVKKLLLCIAEEDRLDGMDGWDRVKVMPVATDEAKVKLSEELDIGELETNDGPVAVSLPLEKAEIGNPVSVKVMDTVSVTKETETRPLEVELVPRDT
jgi:hypothetical protein